MLSILLPHTLLPVVTSEIYNFEVLENTFFLTSRGLEPLSCKTPSHFGPYVRDSNTTLNTDSGDVLMQQRCCHWETTTCA